MAIELDNSFTVPVPPEQAWDVLLDVERIAPCMPGASVTSVEGDEVAGQVKVKLGPLSLTYKGTAKFIGKDQDSHTITLDASGKETRGAGTASANVQAVLKPGDTGGSTLVAIHTSLNVTGRPAQFGRSLLPEVSGKLIAQFATNLEAMITGDSADTAAPEPAETAAGTGMVTSTGATDASPEAAGTTEAAPAAPVAPVVKPAPAARQEESLNAFTFVVLPVLKLIAPVAAAAGAVAAIAVIIRKLTGSRKSS